MADSLNRSAVLLNEFEATILKFQDLPRSNLLGLGHILTYDYPTAVFLSRREYQDDIPSADLAMTKLGAEVCDDDRQNYYDDGQVIGIIPDIRSPIDGGGIEPDWTLARVW